MRCPSHPEPMIIAVPAPHSDEFFLGQAARAVTLVSGENFPVPPEKAGDVLLAGSYNDFFREGLKRYPEARTWKTIYEPTKAELRRRGKELLRAARDYDTVIVLLPDEEISILLNELEPISEKVVVISVLSPAHLNDLGWVRTALAVYGTGEDSFRAAFAALAGDFSPEGILPIPWGIGNDLETGRTRVRGPSDRLAQNRRMEAYLFMREDQGLRRQSDSRPHSRRPALDSQSGA